MKSYWLNLLLCLFIPSLLKAQEREQRPPRQNIPLDSIILSDPFILADQKTNMYYMTGTGGMLWKSKDLALWEGPYRVAETNPGSWMGPRPMIWAAEIHPYKGKYYYFATFTNRAVKIDTVRGNVIERRACHVLVSDRPDGPYVPMKDSIYLPADKPTLDGTLWIDKDGKPYMVYCYEWLQNWNGTIEKIELKPDLSGFIEGSDRVIIPRGNAMGEGNHLYKINGKYYITNADNGRLQCARAANIEGPYETTVVSAKETMGTTLDPAS